jgi:hypothetical protein
VKLHLTQSAASGEPAMTNNTVKGQKVSACEALKIKHLQNNVFALYRFKALKLIGLQDKCVTFFQERQICEKSDAKAPT